MHIGDFRHLYLCFCGHASYVSMNEAEVARKNSRLAIKLFLIAIGMIGFSIALIPMYDVLTEKTGINGKLDAPANEALLKFAVDKQREIRVDFINSFGQSTLLEIRMETAKLQAYPGQFYDVTYHIKNKDGAAVSVRAVPSIAPGIATANLKMVDCFCFTPVEFEAGEIKQLKLRFVIDPKLPQEYKDIAIALTFLNTNKKFKD